MLYLNLDDYFNLIFDEVRNLVYDDIEKPCYEKELTNIKRLESILELVKNDRYYKGFYKKSAYFFVSLSTGHIFNNGNKRIAIYSFMFFVYLNKYRFRNIKKAVYKRWFFKHFPSYKLEEDEFYTNYGWALFNFNKAVNIKIEEKEYGHDYNFNDLKAITEDFFRFILRKQ